MNRYRLLHVRREMREKICFFFLLFLVSQSHLMLLTILTQMSTDEQRVQLLQRLRKKLSNYNLNWMDIRRIVALFAQQIRFEILQFLMEYVSKNMEIEDYIDLANQCTQENEQLKIRLFEQMSPKLNIRNKTDLDRISQTIPIKQKLQAMIRIRIQSDLDEQFSADHLHSSCQSMNAKNILPPINTSFVEQLSRAPLKRRHSFDEEYRDQSSHQMLTPVSLIQQEEFIQQRDTFLSNSINSSNSSLSSTSHENLPVRTHSFMMAIRKTFERLKETSS